MATCRPLRTVLGSKDITERPEKLPPRRPIRDGEDDVGERPAVIVLQRLPEIGGSAVRIVLKGAATPCAQHESGMSERVFQ